MKSRMKTIYGLVSCCSVLTKLLFCPTLLFFVIWCSIWLFKRLSSVKTLFSCFEYGKQISNRLKCGFLKKSFIMNAPLVSCPFPVITFVPSLNTQSCIKGLLVVRDFCFWAVWAAGPVLKKKVGGQLWASFECVFFYFFRVKKNF